MPPPECDRRGPRALLFFVVSLAVVLVTRTAGAATTVRDGDDYSIDLPDLCFVTPIALRTPGACAGLELPEHAPPSPGPEVRTVASGSFGRRPHTATNVGVLYLAKVHLDAPDEDALASLRKDALSIVQHLTTLPPGAHVRDPVGVTIVETPAGPAVRLLIDVDGILSDAPNNAVFLQHQVHYLLPTEEGTYLTSWSMPADSAAFYTPVADASIATAHVARPALSRNAAIAYELARTTVHLIGGAIVFGAIVLAIVILARRSRRPTTYVVSPYPSVTVPPVQLPIQQLPARQPYPSYSTYNSHPHAHPASGWQPVAQVHVPPTGRDRTVLLRYAAARRFG